MVERPLRVSYADIQVGRCLAPEGGHVGPRSGGAPRRVSVLIRRLRCGLHRMAAVDALRAQLENRSLYASEAEADNAEQLAQELLVIQSIYGEDHLELVHEDSEERTLLAHVPVEVAPRNVVVRVQIRLPLGYPASDVPPTLTVCNRYIGPYRAEEDLHTFVQNIFHDDTSSVLWVSGESLLFEGIESVVDFIRAWYERKLSQQRDTQSRTALTSPRPEQHGDEQSSAPIPNPVLLSEVVRSTSLVERKSEFLGHAVRLTHPDHVPLYLAHIVESDKRIQRATHPTMHAWVCRTADGVLHHGMAAH